MEFHVQGDPFEQPGYAERQIDNYTVKTQPGRMIRIEHVNLGQIDILQGYASSLIEALEWARDIQLEEAEDDD